jgi:DNA modification methylase
MILRGNALEGLPFPDGMFHCAITSPPYWGLRSYGDDEGELGRSGQSLDEYLSELVTICAEVRRCLADDGLFFLNVGDTASGSGGAGGDYNDGGSKEDRPKWKQGDSGLPPRTWCNVPGQLALRLVEDGWLLRSEIVWDKGRERRESLAHVKRPRPAHEMIYMLAKQTPYRFFPDELTETGTVWHFPPESSGKKGQAPFPDELPRRCIEIATEPGDWVLDPFAGSGTTNRVAETMGRKAIGVDLYAEETPEDAKAS